jgi:hypothetical protein
MSTQPLSSNLSAQECEELAASLSEEAVTLPPREKQELLKLARGYSSLAKLKAWVTRNVN